MIKPLLLATYLMGWQCNTDGFCVNLADIQLSGLSIITTEISFMLGAPADWKIDCAMHTSTVSRDGGAPNEMLFPPTSLPASLCNHFYPGI